MNELRELKRINDNERDAIIAGTKREMLQSICDIWLKRGEGVDSEMFIRQQMKHTQRTIAACLAKIEAEAQP